MNKIINYFSDNKKINKKLINNLLISPQFIDIPYNFVSKTGLTKSDIHDKLLKQADCCTNIEVSTYEDNTQWVTGANYCQNTLTCLPCARARQSKNRSRYHRKIDKAKTQYKYCYQVTFTIPGGTDIYERLNFLNASLIRMRKKGQKRGEGRSYGEMRKVKYGIVSREIKEGAGSGLWHVHGHALLWTNEKIDYRLDEDRTSKWTREWTDSTEGAAVNCYIENKTIRSKNINDAVNELIKYGTDFKRENIQNHIDLLSGAYNRRLISTMGENLIEYDDIVKELVGWVKLNRALRRSEANRIEKDTDIELIRGDGTKLKRLIEGTEKKPGLFWYLSSYQVARIVRFFGLNDGLPWGIEANFNIPTEVKNYVWSNVKESYEVSCDPQQHRLRAKARQLCAKVTGIYRGARSKVLSENSDGMYKILDNLKASYRDQVKQIWKDVFNVDDKVYNPLPDISRWAELVTGYYSSHF